MSISETIERRNAAIAEIKDRYLDKRNRLLLEMQWEIDAVEREYLKDLFREGARRAA